MDGIKDTHLSTDGITDRNRQANEAHSRNKPVPSDTKIWTPLLLIASVFLINTVHRLEPIKRNRLPATENIVETKKVKLFLANPLGKHCQRYRCYKKRQLYERDQG